MELFKQFLSEIQLVKLTVRNNLVGLC